jgi:hypothetical protein
MVRERQISRDLLVQEFLDAVRERAEAHYRGRMDKAFVAWYVEAEFGKSAEWDFTDDTNDGGIDAVVRRPGERTPVVLIQSKFSERVGKTLAGVQAYKEFDRVVEAFRWKDGSFQAFIEDVREDARRPYQRAYQLLRDVNHWSAEKHAFRLITTLNPRNGYQHSSLPDTAYYCCDEILELYRLFRKGHTPRAADLTLHVGEKLPYRDPNRRVTSYLFNARLSDFRRYFDAYDVDRLVARNIRYKLAGPIGRGIRRTYEENPHNFWYVHNGITIICDSFQEKRGIATLTNPSVVNGAQTLYAISSSPKKQSAALVAVRVVVRGRHGDGDMEDDDWVREVIRGVNTQNRVRNQDFRSNEPEQVELQRLFREVDIFYERKRGEFRVHRNDHRYRGFERASMRNVGMALTAVSEDDGSGVVLVKRGVDAIFELENYQKLFPKRRNVTRSFKRIYLAHRLMHLVRDSAFKGSRFRKYRHAYWTAVWMAFRGIDENRRLLTNASLPAIRDAFDRLEGATREGRQARAEVKRLRDDLWRAWRRSNRAVGGAEPPVNFFKSRPAHQRLLKSVYPAHRMRLRAIGKELLS